MHLPLLTRCLFLLVQFLILTMALPAVSPLPPQNDELAERDAPLPTLDAEDQDSAATHVDPHASGRKFGRSVRVVKGPMGSPVEAKVGERDPEGKKEV